MKYFIAYNTEDLLNPEWAQIPLFLPLGTDNREFWKYLK